MKKISVSKIYYVLVALCYVATLLFSQVRPGVVATVLMLLVFTELALKKKITFDCVEDWIVTAFFAYQLLSGTWLVAGGYPFSVFANEFVTSTLPMVFYFVGKSAADEKGKWYRMYVYAIILIGALGVIMYIAAPRFYIDWAYRWSYISKADVSTMRVRMHSVVGSTVLSFISVAGMLAGSYFLADIKNADDARGGKKGGSIVFSIVSMVLCLLFSIMANQRSGLVVAALVIVFVNYLLFFRLDLIPRKYFIYEIIAIAAVFAAICVIRFEFILKFWWRIISLPTAISQRSEQWVAAVNNMYSSWIGNGLGANGHKAIGLEDAHVITDGGLVKMYCEMGVIGFSMFVYSVICALKRGLADIADHFAEVGIIVAALLQSIGSNMLAFQLCCPVFWFAMGCCMSSAVREVSRRKPV